MSDRLVYIDKLRGFAILLVVLGHSFMRYTVDGNCNPVAQMIYSFHMPLFFFISGFICEKTHKINVNGYFSFLKKKIISLLLPYLFWTAACCFLWSSQPNVHLSMFLDSLSFFPYNGFWFMPVLFILMLLYTLQHFIIGNNDTLRKRWLFLVLVCILTALCGVFFHQYHIIVYSIFIFSFLFGSILSYSVRLLDLMKTEKVFGGGSLLLCILWTVYPLPANGTSLISFYNLVCNFLCSVFAIVAFFNFFYREKFNRCVDWFLCEMGKYSLVIYLTPFLLLPEGFVFKGYTTAAVNILLLLLGIIHCLISYCIGRFVYAIPYLRLVMYGKK